MKSYKSLIGSIMTDSHFVYTSGRHGSAYVNKDAVYAHTNLVSEICRHSAEEFRDMGVSRVVGPAVGGVALSQWTTHHLRDLTSVDNPEVLSIYSDKEGDLFVIERGYDLLIPGQNVLVVEDVVTTGGSIFKVIEEVRRLGGNVVGAAIFCNRCAITAAELEIPKLYSFFEVLLETHEADN